MGLCAVALPPLPLEQEEEVWKKLLIIGLLAALAIAVTKILMGRKTAQS